MGGPEASLTIADTSATLLILASGSCYGSFGQIDAPIPSGSFALSGTYTPLIGAYPGKVQYAAQFSGLVDGGQLSITITVPSLQRVVEPFSLTAWRSATWPMCLYP